MITNITPGNAKKGNQGNQHYEGRRKKEGMKLMRIEFSLKSYLVQPPFFLPFFLVFFFFGGLYSLNFSILSSLLFCCYP